MRHSKLMLFALLGLFMFSNSVAAQTDRVIIYNGVNFQGANMTLNESWKGGGGFDRNIKSIRVPKGYRVRIYEGKNYKGTESLLTEDWNPGAGAYWFGRIRSIRIEKAQIQPPIQPPISGSFPVIYAQANFQGPAEAIERGFAGRRDWEGSPHRIRSIRVPQGWFLVLYDKRNFRGKSYNLTSDWTPQPGDYWYGRIKSIKVYKGNPPIQPR